MAGGGKKKEEERAVRESFSEEVAFRVSLKGQ